MQQDERRKDPSPPAIKEMFGPYVCLEDLPLLDQCLWFSEMLFLVSIPSSVLSNEGALSSAAKDGVLKQSIF